MANIARKSSDIMERLEKLNRWQEEQKKILVEKQNNQRQLLGIEHKEICKKLGIRLCDQDKIDPSNRPTPLDLSILDKSRIHSKDISKTVSFQENLPKKPFLRRKEGLIKRFKIDPDLVRSFALNKPEKRSSKKVQQKKSIRNCKGIVTSLPNKLNLIKTHEKSQNKTDDVTNLIELDLLEDNSQSIISFPENGRLKNMSDTSNTGRTSDEHLKNIPPNALDLLEEKFQKTLMFSKTVCNSTPDTKPVSHSQTSDKTNSPKDPMSWAAILDPQNIKPINVESTDTSWEDGIFELIEAKTNRPSFDINNSTIQEFIKKAKARQDTEEIDDTNISFTIEPDPADLYETTKDTEDEEEVIEQPKAINQVRFKEIDESTDASQGFRDFKEQVFEDLSTANTTINSDFEIRQQLQHQAELVKQRLHELESQISSFKELNIELNKAKQEHELEKSQLQKYYLDMHNEISDKKVEMELYFHDERLKIQTEREEMERQAKQKKCQSSAKDQQTIKKLKEELETLKSEMRKKDETHVAAQSRLRAQIRNFEKDVKQLQIELEIVNKENKRLQAEVARATRQDSMKLLHEINRNLAKLAPKDQPQKSSYCAHVQRHAQYNNRTVEVVNLDPAAEHFEYQPLVDMRDLIELDDVMEDDELQLGPNGALIFCMEFLLQNNDWLRNELCGGSDSENEGEPDGDYILFDMPGQIELFTHLKVGKELVQLLESWNFRVCTLFLLDSQFMTDGAKFLSGTLTALSVMCNLEMPHINVLTKIDQLSEPVIRDLEKYLYPDVDAVLHPTNQRKPLGSDHARLSNAIGDLIENYSMVRFIPLNVEDPESIQDLLLQINTILQYGEECELTVIDELKAEGPRNRKLKKHTSTRAGSCDKEDEMNSTLAVKKTSDETGMSTEEERCLNEIEETDQPREPLTLQRSSASYLLDNMSISSEGDATNQNVKHESQKFKRREIDNADGSKDIWYPNGNLKKVSPDEMVVQMLYFNKDIKETNLKAGTVKYYYASVNTWHTTYLDGLEILEFPNGQTEHRYKGGKVEVYFPDNSVKITYPDGDRYMEWKHADGSISLYMRNGEKVLILPNGQREIHTTENKRREYPDGTVKLLYPDGSQETRYSNGRIRLKDKNGLLIVDSMGN